VALLFLLACAIERHRKYTGLAQVPLRGTHDHSALSDCCLILHAYCTLCLVAAVLQIVTSAIENPNVVATCAGSELMKNMLPHLLEQLELCQKSLSAYLETKRAEFPRCR
jgi:hypothetical protein